MTSVSFYFQVHQPYRLNRFSFFDIGSERGYFDDTENERILRRVAEKCYLPMNELLLDLINEHDGKFRFAMATTGTLLDQLERWHPEALESFKRLSETGCVEFICETSHHSLAFLSDQIEFEAQVKAQRDTLHRHFNSEPTTFRCTELVISNDIAKSVEAMGFKALLGEGADQLLGWRSPNQTYRPKGCKSLSLLLRSYSLSDDIAFRFSNQSWDRWPLTAPDFVETLQELPDEAEFAGLFMDYETFGEHQWRETGIFDFMQYLPAEILKHERFDFATPGEVAAAHPPKLDLDIPHPVSWADAERDLTAWLGNAMQRSADEALYKLGPDARRTLELGRSDLYADWQKLTTSDHVYYMCTKWFSDGDVHKYFSPYTTPHDACIAFMNVLADLELRLRAALGEGGEGSSKPNGPGNAGAQAEPDPKRSQASGKTREAAGADAGQADGGAQSSIVTPVAKKAQTGRENANKSKKGAAPKAGRRSKKQRGSK